MKADDFNDDFHDSYAGRPLKDQPEWYRKMIDAAKKQITDRIGMDYDPNEKIDITKPGSIWMECVATIRTPAPSNATPQATHAAREQAADKRPETK